MKIFISPQREYKEQSLLYHSGSKNVRTNDVSKGGFQLPRKSPRPSIRLGLNNAVQSRRCVLYC